MKIRRFFGKDMREALKLVKDELGGDAVIMSNKKVANGIELVAAIDPAEKMPDAKTQDKVSATPSLSEIIGDSGPDSLQALLEQQKSQQHNQTNGQQAEKTETPVAKHASNKQRSYPAYNEADQNLNQLNREPEKSLHYSQQAGYGDVSEPRADNRIFRSPAFSEEENVAQQHASSQAGGIQPPPSVLEPEKLDVIKAELESIKNVLKFQVSELSDERRKRNNPVHSYLHEQIINMGISEHLAKQFIEFLPHQVDEKEGWKYILNLLSNRLHIGGNDILTQSGVVALVGPTGTGKTTTLAKLAAKYAQKYGAENVAMVTIDTYRIAAFEQLSTYGKIIGCSVKKAHNSQELNDCLYQLRNKKLVLIDTAGFSQRDHRLISQLNEYESNINLSIKKYLVLPAGAQYQVLKQTVKAYRSTEIKGCIFSKLDECYSLGEALSVIIENDMSLSYVTDGQRVPEDIKLADSANLTLIAAKLFRKYGSGMQHDQIVENTSAEAGVL
ncbi:flagellar biosynthesis protein FlhF [Glaciecola petra]|uniref:Flagellar biosynthesis protein FlhF n=1 Tax=Glaciecola petra TaxID=3075602 RepID=A0ABU2ZQE4_9ALTE|nr:flagellar biosynthesis protein FlhF [Aestuariibacter sp. P117]MDT0593824.1 flagellar biosynthesis protein FlhF [Aestuariibacter sp. P117]